MIATIISEKTKHYPVLLNEIIGIITPQYGGTFIDCTFGQGGYTKKILEFPNTKVIGIDRDIDSKNISKNYIFFKNPEATRISHRITYFIILIYD